MLAIILFVAILVGACGQSTQRVPTAVERPGQPWPDNVSACAIPRLPESYACSSAITISSDAEGQSPVATIAQPSKADFTWSELPVLGSGNRARVEVFTPIRFSGWSAPPDLAFSLTQDVSIRSNNLVAKARTPVTVLGTSGDKVVVQVPAPFETPDVFEVAVPCQSLRYGHSQRGGRRDDWTKGYVTARPNTPIALSESPNGEPFLVFEASPRQIFRSVEQSDGSLRVAGGGAMVSHSLSTIVFDGWADVRQFNRLNEPPADNDGGHCIPDISDLCPSNTGKANRDTKLNYGPEPPGQYFATAKIGTTVRIDESFDEFVALSFVDVLEPPRGMRYYMKRDAVSIDCHGEEVEVGVDLDGCPPCVPTTR